VVVELVGPVVVDVVVVAVVLVPVVVVSTVVVNSVVVVVNNGALVPSTHSGTFAGKSHVFKSTLQYNPSGQLSNSG